MADEEWDALYASSSSRELFRYSKGGRSRRYLLKTISGRETALWVVSEEKGQVTATRKLTTFEDPNEAGLFLEDIEKELRLGGWMNVSR